MFKNTIITASTKKRELIIFLACFAIAFILNVVGIIKHQTPIKELITELHIVLLVCLVLYGGKIFLQVLYHLVSRVGVRK